MSSTLIFWPVSSVGSDTQSNCLACMSWKPGSPSLIGAAPMLMIAVLRAVCCGAYVHVVLDMPCMYSVSL